MKNNFWKTVKNKLGKISSYLIIALTCLLLISLIRNFFKINETNKKVEKIKARIEKLRQENNDLQQKLSQVTSQENIEKQIRDKLGLAKEGEIVVILPDEETLKKSAPVIYEEKDFLPDPTWKKWLKLFF